MENKGNFFLLLCLVTAVGYSNAGNCTEFSNNLQNDVNDTSSFWWIHSTLGGAAAKVYFAGNDIRAYRSDWGATMELLSNVTCDLDLGGDRYVIAYDNTTGIETGLGYLCVQFIQHTPNVIGIRAGEYAGAACGDLEDAAWPLVANTPRETNWNACPGLGGYQFRAAVVQAGDAPGQSKNICATHPVPSSLQVECMKGEGISLEFPDVTCIPENTGWGIKQSLYCMDTWDDLQYEYATLGLSYYEPAWCMRMPKSRVGTFTVHIFQDMTCPSEDIPPDTNYLEMNLTVIDTTTCEDEVQSCSIESCSDSLKSKFCRKTCAMCDPSTAGCSFPNDQAGVEQTIWYQTEEEGTFDLDLGNTTLRLQDFGNFTCHQEVNPNMFVLQSEVPNGCSPRYTCAYFDRQTRGVLQYKLSQSKESYSSEYDICVENEFEDDPPPLGDRYRSRFMKNLVAADENLREPSECGFRGEFAIHGDLDDVPCQGVMSDLSNCTTLPGFSISVTCNNTEYSANFTCLATFKPRPKEPEFLITTTSFDDKIWNSCWILPDSHINVIHLLQSSQCNEATPPSMAAGIKKPFFSALTERVDECDGENTSISPTVTESYDNGTTIETGNLTVTAFTDVTGTESEFTTQTSEKTTASQATTPVTTPPPGGLSGGAIAAIVIAVFVLVPSIGVGIYWLRKNTQICKRLPYRVL